MQVTTSMLWTTRYPLMASQTHGSCVFCFWTTVGGIPLASAAAATSWFCAVFQPTKKRAKLRIMTWIESWKSDHLEYSFPQKACIIFWSFCLNALCKVSNDSTNIGDFHICTINWGPLRNDARRCYWQPWSFIIIEIPSDSKTKTVILFPNTPWD